MKTATRFKLSNSTKLSTAKCKQWVKEMKKNPLEVENEISRLIHMCTADTGRIIEKEINIITAHSAVIYIITHSPNKFMEIIISFKRDNLNEWDGWEKDKSVIKTYRLEEDK